MSDDYTPTTEEVETHWADVGFAGDRASFRRWLTDVKRQAFRQGVDAGSEWPCDEETVEAATGPTPGGLPGLTDAEAEAFLAAIDKSEPNAEEADRADH